MAKREDKGHDPKGGRRMRKKHGTRVAVQIVCSECGKQDTLEYMPKGVKLTHVLCSACMGRATDPDSEWSMIEKERKEARPLDWEFLCSECGLKDYLPFEPHEDRFYECQRCLHDHEAPDPSRLAGKEEVKAHVFRRRAVPKQPD
jgi:CxxC-x17-CxxC domain-containing protein